MVVRRGFAGNNERGICVSCVFATWQKTSEDSEHSVQCVIGSGHAYPLGLLGAGGYTIKPISDSKPGVFGSSMCCYTTESWIDADPGVGLEDGIIHPLANVDSWHGHTVAGASDRMPVLSACAQPCLGPTFGPEGLYTLTPCLARPTLPGMGQFG